MVCADCHIRLLRNANFCHVCGGQAVRPDPQQLFAVVDAMRGIEVCVVERECLERLEAALPGLFADATGCRYFAGTVTRELIAALPPRWRAAKRALKQHVIRWHEFGFAAGSTDEHPGIRHLVAPGGRGWYGNA